MDPTFLANILAFMGRHWKIMAIAGLLGTNTLTLNACNGEHKALTKEKAAHAADIKSYKDAQAAADKMAQAEKTRLEQENKDKANAADDNYNALYAKYRANLLRYSAAQGAAHQSGTGQPDGTAQGDNGPSAGPFLPEGQLTITNEDANICAVNTARLQAAHDWAETLNDKGH